MNNEWLRLAADGRWDEASDDIRNNGWGDPPAEELRQFVARFSVPGETPESTAGTLAEEDATYLGCLGTHDHFRWLRLAAHGLWDDAAIEAHEQLASIQFALRDTQSLKELIWAIATDKHTDARTMAYDSYLALLREQQTSDEYIALVSKWVHLLLAISEAEATHTVPKETVRWAQEDPAEAESGYGLQAGDLEQHAGFSQRRSRDKQRAESLDEKKEKAARVITRQVRAAITKRNVDAFDKLPPETGGPGGAKLDFAVYHPEGGEAVLRFDVTNMPTIQFAYTYTGTLSIPAKGTRNPLTALRRRAKNEHIRGDVTIWSDHTAFAPEEVEKLLHATITKKTVSRRANNLATIIPEYKNARDFLARGIGTPEWEVLKREAEKKMVAEIINFMEAIHAGKMTGKELFERFVLLGAEEQINLYEPSAGPLREKYDNASDNLGIEDFGPALTEVTDLIVADPHFIQLIKNLAHVTS
ncbi:hypothetical protein [Streptomyces sp. NPDC051014]|uniref:hypothetical protein n=1 Tax=Streptomyces sp. NPDC051014 TaxID=3155751 RepID=UPI0033CD091F